jgi:hypothetical protein
MTATASTLVFAAVAAAAIAASMATPAHADDITPSPAFTSSRTRAEVKAEQQQFARDGVNPWADNFTALQSPQSTKTRAEVIAELQAWREETGGMSAEDSVSGYVPAGAVRPRVHMAGDLDNLR